MFDHRNFKEEKYTTKKNISFFFLGTPEYNYVVRYRQNLRWKKDTYSRILFNFLRMLRVDHIISRHSFINF